MPLTGQFFHNIWVSFHWFWHEKVFNKTLEYGFHLGKFHPHENVTICRCKVRWIWWVRQNRPIEFLIFFSFIVFYFCWHGGEYQLSCWRGQDTLQPNFLWTHCSCWSYKCAFSISLCFQNSKLIINQWSHHTDKLGFLIKELVVFTLFELFSSSLLPYLVQ